MEGKIEIKISDVIAMNAEGKTRAEIGAHYGLSPADTTALFKDPELKGIRIRKPRAFVIVRDTQTQAEPVAEETTEVEVEENQSVQEEAEVNTVSSDWQN